MTDKDKTTGRPGSDRKGPLAKEPGGMGSKLLRALEKEGQIPAWSGGPGQEAEGPDDGPYYGPGRLAGARSAFAFEEPVLDDQPAEARPEAETPETRPAPLRLQPRLQAHFPTAPIPAEPGPTLWMGSPDRFRGLMEQLRGIKNTFMSLKREKNQSLFSLTGPADGVGVSGVAFNLALVMAWDLADARLLLVDGNLASPSLHKSFRRPMEPGLINYLLDGVDIQDVLAPSRLPNLHLITAGRSRRRAYSPFDLARFDYLLEVARREYDFAIFDTASCLKNSSSRILARKADGVVLVVKANETRREVVQEMVRVLEEDDAEIVGGVLNMRQFVIPKFLYRFS